MICRNCKFDLHGRCPADCRCGGDVPCVSQAVGTPSVFRTAAGTASPFRPA